MRTLPNTRAKALPAGAVATLPATRTAHRIDGWTPERQAAFLRALASSHNVAAAARAVGMSRQSAYRLRARYKGQPFDLAWDAAFQCAFDALAAAAMDRALNGVEVPHFHKGELVGTSRHFDERLTIALLRMRGDFLRPPAPPTYAASDFEPEDFPGLLARVARGPARWEDEGDEDDGGAAWPDDERDEDGTARPTGGEATPGGDVSPGAAQ